MALLDDKIVKDVTEMLSELTDEVKLVAFTDDQECEYCPQIIQLLTEVAATSGKVSLEQYEIHKAPEKAASFDIKVAPAFAVLGKKDYGLRFYGIPSGYEFSTLLHAIQKAGTGISELDERTKDYLHELKQPVDLQVFVTPTCPYCPRGATLAYEMAMESDMVHARVVESMEFQEWATMYNVMGVPLTVVNSKERIEGAAPPNMVVEAIQKSLA
ncbi:MAG: thioredoxin family protein [Anaerolineae bacterium]|nr:thioredoxin family protein [Anaerolineae bacterium]